MTGPSDAELIAAVLDGNIESFAGLTTVPMLLNTSFNENEPVVCRPEEALDCFLRTNMDALVMGGFFIERV